LPALKKKTGRKKKIFFTNVIKLIDSLFLFNKIIKENMNLLNKQFLNASNYYHYIPELIQQLSNTGQIFYLLLFSAFSMGMSNFRFELFLLPFTSFLSLLTCYPCDLLD